MNCGCNWMAPCSSTGSECQWRDRLSASDRMSVSDRLSASDWMSICNNSKCTRHQRLVKRWQPCSGAKVNNGMMFIRNGLVCVHFQHLSYTLVRRNDTCTLVPTSYGDTSPPACIQYATTSKWGPQRGVGEERGGWHHKTTALGAFSRSNDTETLLMNTTLNYHNNYGRGNKTYAHVQHQVQTAEAIHVISQPSHPAYVWQTRQHSPCCQTALRFSFSTPPYLVTLPSPFHLLPF